MDHCSPQWSKWTTLGHCSPVMWTIPNTSSNVEMAAHSSILAWRILWTEEPGGLLSIGSHRVRHDWSDFACMHWRRKWQPPPVFLPGESQGRRSLVGCPLWGCTKSDTTIKSHSSSSSSSRWRTFKMLWEYLTPYIKSNSIWIKDQNITAKGTKFPEENIRQWFLKYDPTH